MFVSSTAASDPRLAAYGLHSDFGGTAPIVSRRQLSAREARATKPAACCLAREYRHPKVVLPRIRECAAHGTNPLSGGRIISARPFHATKPPEYQLPEYQPPGYKLRRYQPEDQQAAPCRPEKALRLPCPIPPCPTARRCSTLPGRRCASAHPDRRPSPANSADRTVCHRSCSAPVSGRLPTSASPGLCGGQYRVHGICNEGNETWPVT